jgi:hypothetical protein
MNKQLIRQAKYPRKAYQSNFSGLSYYAKRAEEAARNELFGICDNCRIPKAVRNENCDHKIK